MQKLDQDNQEPTIQRIIQQDQLLDDKQEVIQTEEQQSEIQEKSKEQLNYSIQFANLNFNQLRAKAEQIVEQLGKNPKLFKRVEQITQLCTEGLKHVEAIIFLINNQNEALHQEEKNSDYLKSSKPINFYTTNLVISYLNRSILEKLQELLLNFDNLTKEQQSLLVIYTAKLKACIEQIPKAMVVPNDDLFSINKDHPKWQLIKNHISEKVLGDSQQIIQSYDKVCEGLLLGEALISIESEYKNVIQQNLMTGIGAVYYTIHKRQMKIRAQHFMAEASQEAALKALNFSETQIGKAVLGLVLTSITYNQIIYLPKLFKPITRESILHQYETGDINKINNDIGQYVPENNLTFEELFKQRNQRVQVRVLCHQNLQHVQQTIFQQFLKMKQGNFNFEKVIIHLHGSGFVALSSYPHQIYTRKWAKSLKIPIFSIDYCKAPDHPYPEGLDDCWQTYMFIITYISQYFNIIPKKVVLVGDSSGGNLCTSLTIQCIKAGVRIPDGMLLSYPSLQLDGRYFTPSILLCLDDSLLSHKVLNLCVESYIRPEFNTLIDPLISPFNASDEILSKFPRTRIIIGTHDPLHDESLRFLLKLVELGKDVRLVEYTAMPHGFLSLDVITGMKESKQAVIDAQNLLNELLS